MEGESFANGCIYLGNVSKYILDECDGTNPPCGELISIDNVGNELVATAKIKEEYLNKYPTIGYSNSARDGKHIMSANLVCVGLTKYPVFNTKPLNLQ